MTIQPYEAHPVAARPSLLDPATDSWTAVVSDAIKLAQVIAPTEFVPAGLRGSVPKVTAAILHGRELGLPPLTALAGVHVIAGKAGISAELMRALILQAGHQLAITESTASRCVMQGRRTGWEEWTKVAYTMEEAIKSGDAKKNPNYGSRPADMLLARATTRLARMIFADVTHGLRSAEELQDMAGDDTGEVYVVPEVEQVTVSRQAAPSAPAVEAAPASVRGARAGSPAGAAGGEVAGPATPAASPRERRRPPLTRRGPAAPEESGQPEPAPEPSQDAPPAPAAPSESDLFRKTVQAAVMHFQRLQVEERTERLWATQVLVGRPVKSTNELSLVEVRELAKKLERMRDHDALEAALAEGQGDE